MVVQQHNVEFVAFLHCGDDFLRHHQVGAISNEDIDFAIRIGHLHAQSTGDLITHAGVAILHVISARLPGSPKFVKFSGQTARGADHNVGRLQEVVQDADQLGLRDGWTLPQAMKTIDFFLPLSAEGRDLVRVSLFHLVAGERLRAVPERSRKRRR